MSTFYSLGVYVLSFCFRPYIFCHCCCLHLLSDGCCRPSTYNQKWGGQHNASVSKKMGAGMLQENSESPSTLPQWTMYWAGAWDGGISLALSLTDFARLLTFLCLSYPSFPALLCLWMWGSGPGSPGICMMPSWVWWSLKTLSSWAQAFLPSCISLLAGLSLSYKQYGNSSIPRPDFTPQHLQILFLF